MLVCVCVCAIVTSECVYVCVASHRCVCLHHIDVYVSATVSVCMLVHVCMY